MRLILHIVNQRLQGGWDAATGRTVALSEFRYQAPPLWENPLALMGDLGAFQRAEPRAPTIHATLEDGTPLAVEHVEFWLGRLGPPQRARLWWAWLRWRLRLLAPSA